MRLRVFGTNDATSHCFLSNNLVGCLLLVWFFFFLAEEVEPQTLFNKNQWAPLKRTLLLWGNGVTAPVCLREQRRNNIRIMEEARVSQRVRHVSNTKHANTERAEERLTEEEEEKCCVCWSISPTSSLESLTRAVWITEALTLTAGSKNNLWTR